MGHNVILGNHESININVQLSFPLDLVVYTSTLVHYSMFPSLSFLSLCASKYILVSHCFPILSSQCFYSFLQIIFTKGQIHKVYK